MDDSDDGTYDYSYSEEDSDDGMSNKGYGSHTDMQASRRKVSAVVVAQFPSPSSGSV
jgi:hypothetical protein